MSFPSLLQQEGMTAVMVAIEKERSNIVEVLLVPGAQADLENNV